MVQMPKQWFKFIISYDTVNLENFMCPLGPFSLAQSQLLSSLEYPYALTIEVTMFDLCRNLPEHDNWTYHRSNLPGMAVLLEIALSKQYSKRTFDTFSCLSKQCYIKCSELSSHAFKPRFGSVFLDGISNGFRIELTAPTQPLRSAKKINKN